MVIKYKREIVWLVILIIILPLHEASADTGPKPSMDFTFKQAFSGAPVTIMNGTLFECQQRDCSDAIPLQRLGPQGFSCAPTSCSALAYGFSAYHRLEITFSDGRTRQSNIFNTAQFQATYQVTIRPDDLLVESKFNLNLFTKLNYVLICSICLAGIAILAICIVLIYRRKSTQK
jgi:hypothetical protein